MNSLQSPSQPSKILPSPPPSRWKYFQTTSNLESAVLNSDQESTINDFNPHKAPDTTKKPLDNFFYPAEVAGFLDRIDLPKKQRDECLGQSWEYARAVIPTYTNWKRYVAFMKIIIIGIVAEYRGDLFDIATEPNNALGHNFHALIEELFGGTVGQRQMLLEYRCYLLTTQEKSSLRKHNSEFFRRYVNSIAQSPKAWFRMRDTDALARFTIYAALVCNDIDDFYFTEPQWDILTEIGDVMYDSVAFYKHRSEGETHSTYAYTPVEIRTEAFGMYREILFALDHVWTERHEKYHQATTNFLRQFGGAIHITMRRYRFVEEGLTLGKREDEVVVDQTRQNFKLWTRFDAKELAAAKLSHEANLARYKNIMSLSDELMIPGMAEYIEAGGEGLCNKCLYRESYGAKAAHQFGGVKLCEDCTSVFKDYIESFPIRAAEVFPELLSVPGYTKEVRTLA